MFFNLITLKLLLIYLSSCILTYYLFRFFEFKIFFKVNILLWYIMIGIIVGFTGPHNYFLNRILPISLTFITVLKGIFFGLFFVFFRKKSFENH